MSIELNEDDCRKNKKVVLRNGKIVELRYFRNHLMFPIGFQFEKELHWVSTKGNYSKYRNTLMDVVSFKIENKNKERKEKMKNIRLQPNTTKNKIKILQWIDKGKAQVLIDLKWCDVNEENIKLFENHENWFREKPEKIFRDRTIEEKMELLGVAFMRVNYGEVSLFCTTYHQDQTKIEVSLDRGKTWEKMQVEVKEEEI